MTYRYLTQDDATAVIASQHPEARRLPALSALLDSELLWDQPARTLVYLVDSWVDNAGYRRRMHTCIARNITSDKDLAFGFSRAARKADPELVAAAADEILNMVAAGITAPDVTAASAAITAVLHSGLAESPSRSPMFAALRTQRQARTLAE